MRSYTVDFETIVDPDKTRIWAWALCNIDTFEFECGNSEDSFMDRILRCKNSTNFYFHNLKFDGEFLLYMLNNRRFTYYSHDELEDDRKIPEGHYMTLINAEGCQWYKLSVCIKRNKTRVVMLNFYDSSKIFPMSIADMAKKFGFDLLKGEINYKLYRGEGHKLTDLEKDYIYRDVLIPARALKMMFSLDLKKMTIGSDALNMYKRAYIDNFDYHFPVISCDTHIRQSYKGGWTYCNEKIKGQDIGKGLVLDVNSLYPWAMYDNLLPFGDPIAYKGKYKYDPLYPIYIQMFQCDFEIKPDHLPCIQLKKALFKPTEWLKSSENTYPVLCMTSIDFELIQEMYDLYNLDYIGGWKFKASRDFFKEYINYWVSIKAKATIEKDQPMRTISKLMLNSLYGKFGSRPSARNKEPFFNDEGLLKYKNTDEYDRPTVYVPMSSFITAYARRKTITTAERFYDRFLYSDTDSLHLIGWEKPDIEIDPVTMGAWDLEEHFTRAKYLGAKCYYHDVLTEDKKIKKSVTVSGLPAYMHDQVTFENFQIGAKYSGKKFPRHIDGGIYLDEIDYIIRER